MNPIINDQVSRQNINQRSEIAEKSSSKEEATPTTDNTPSISDAGEDRVTLSSTISNEGSNSVRSLNSFSDALTLLKNMTTKMGEQPEMALLAQGSNRESLGTLAQQLG